VLVILPARHRHSLGSHEDEDRPSASYPEFSARSAQSGPTRRACRIRPADLAIDLRGSTRESPFADNRYSRFVFSSLDDLHCQRVDSYVDHPVDYPRLSSRILCVSGAAHLHLPDDHLHFFDVDHFLPELVHNDAVMLSEAKYPATSSADRFLVLCKPSMQCTVFEASRTVEVAGFFCRDCGIRVTFIRWL